MKPHLDDDELVQCPGFSADALARAAERLPRQTWLAATGVERVEYARALFEEVGVRDHVIVSVRVDQTIRHGEVPSLSVAHSPTRSGRAALPGLDFLVIQGGVDAGPAGGIKEDASVWPRSSLWASRSVEPFASMRLAQPRAVPFTLARGTHTVVVVDPSRGYA